MDVKPYLYILFHCVFLLVKVASLVKGAMMILNHRLGLMLASAMGVNIRRRFAVLLLFPPLIVSCEEDSAISASVAVENTSLSGHIAADQTWPEGYISPVTSGSIQRQL